MRFLEKEREPLAAHRRGGPPRLGGHRARTILCCGASYRLLLRNGRCSH